MHPIIQTNHPSECHQQPYIMTLHDDNHTIHNTPSMTCIMSIIAQQNEQGNNEWVAVLTNCQNVSYRCNLWQWKKLIPAGASDLLPAMLLVGSDHGKMLCVRNVRKCVFLAWLQKAADIWPTFLCRKKYHFLCERTLNHYLIFGL